MGRRIRAAIVGAGQVARDSHLPALARLAGEIEVVAVADVDPAAVAAFPASEGFSDLEAMLTAVHPNLVVVCTPPGLRRDQVATALRAGAWVWCEKPPRWGPSSTRCTRRRRRAGSGSTANGPRSN